MAFVGDPQVDNAQELDYARASIYSELKARKDLDLVVILGDLVNDNPELLAPSKASLDSLPCPWVCVVGNHDRDMEGIRLTREFENVLGYRDTAFVMKGVKFICMDDVRLEGRAGYIGGFRDSQKHWLDSVLTSTPPKMKAVICTHIPLNEFRARDTLETILSRHKDILLASAHTHNPLRKTLTLGGRDYEDFGAGATCGTWWRGLPDEHGIPAATMFSGDPRGYYIADFRGKRLRLSYKTVGSDRKASATLGEEGELIVNIYGASADGRVKVRTREGRWTAATREERIAPESQAVIDFNLSKDRDYRREHREEFIPMLRHRSEHIWVLPAAGVTPGQELRIRYRDARMKVNCTVNIRRQDEIYIKR